MVGTPGKAREHSDNPGEWPQAKVVSCSQARREFTRGQGWKEKWCSLTERAAFSEGLPRFVRPWPYAHTVSSGEKDLSESSLIVLPPG